MSWSTPILLGSASLSASSILAASAGSGLLPSVGAASSIASPASSEAAGRHFGLVFGQGGYDCGVGGVGGPDTVGFVENGLVGGS